MKCDTRLVHKESLGTVFFLVVVLFFRGTIKRVSQKYAIVYQVALLNNSKQKVFQFHLFIQKWHMKLRSLYYENSSACRIRFQIQSGGRLYRAARNMAHKLKRD